MERIVVVLDRPEDPVNLGAIVRAMKNMGSTRLRLVQPVTYTSAELLRLAHRAEDVIERIEHFATLGDALADAHFVIGTAAIDHAGHRVTSDLRTLATEIGQRTAAGDTVALLFGPEADGLDRAALDRCHVVARIPTDPNYPALNLAQSVLIVLYEIRMAGEPAAVAGEERSLATQTHLERVFEVSEEALQAIGFFKYNPAAVMHTLRQIAYRAELQPDEAALLLAIARQVLRSTVVRSTVVRSTSDGSH